MTISGAFTNGVTIIPIPAKFQTALGSLETDGVVIDPPPSGASDLTIAKTHNPDIAIPGGTVTYTVTVSNVGTGPSSGPVTVTETPPPGLTVTALSGTGWACTVATRTCTRSDALAPGASYPPITVATSVAGGAASGVVTNTAVVSGGGESNSSNNTATDPTIIAAPAPGMDLTITKRHSPQTVVPGQTFSYFIAVSNVGSTASSGVVTVTETPPAGLTVTALAGAGWTCTVATLTCTRSDALAPATSYPDIIVTTSVGAGVAPGTVTNTAVVSGGGDTNNGNNTATDPTVITSPVGGPDLTLLKTPSAGSVAPGQTITFTIRVMNVGNAPTSGTITVTETPPPNLTVTALSGSGWTCVVATRTCLRADALAQGGSYPEITVTAVVAPNAAGTVVNGAVVTGGGDTDPGNGSGTGPIEVVPPVAGSDLTLAKTRTGSGVLVPGQPVTFTVRVTNVGASPTSGTVTVTETPPAGLTVTALSGTGWTCTVAHADVHTRGCARPFDELPRHLGDGDYRRRCSGHGRQRSGGIRRRGFKSRQQHGCKSDRSQSPGSWKRPHAGEGAHRKRHPRAGATSHLYPQGDERRRLADKRYRHRDGDAAGGPHRDRALRHRLDVHRRHADVHARGCARPVRRVTPTSR